MVKTHEPTLKNVLWRTDPLLGKNLKTNKYGCCYAIGEAVSEQWLSKHVPVEINMPPTAEDGVNVVCAKN
jgi:hypothetical protein